MVNVAKFDTYEKLRKDLMDILAAKKAAVERVAVAADKVAGGSQGGTERGTSYDDDEDEDRGDGGSTLAAEAEERARTKAEKKAAAAAPR